MLNNSVWFLAEYLGGPFLEREETQLSYVTWSEWKMMPGTKLWSVSYAERVNVLLRILNYFAPAPGSYRVKRSCPLADSNPKFQIILPLRPTGPHLVQIGLVWPTVKRWLHLPLTIDNPIVRKGIPHLFHSDLISEQSRPPGAEFIPGVGPGYGWTSKPCGSERLEGTFRGWKGIQHA
jgi:hypothetical protein